MVGRGHGRQVGGRRTSSVRLAHVTGTPETPDIHDEVAIEEEHCRLVRAAVSVLDPFM